MLAPSDLFAFKAHFRTAPAAGPDAVAGFSRGYGGLVHSDAGRTSLSCCIRRDMLAKARTVMAAKAAEAVRPISWPPQWACGSAGRAVLKAIFCHRPIHPAIRTRHDDGIFFTGNIRGEAHPVIAEASAWRSRPAASGAAADSPVAGQDMRVNGQRASRAASGRVTVAHLAMNDTTRAISLGVLRAAPRLGSLARG